MVPPPSVTPNCSKLLYVPWLLVIAPPAACVKVVPVKLEKSTFNVSVPAPPLMLSEDPTVASGAVSTVIVSLPPESVAMIFSIL